MFICTDVQSVWSTWWEDLKLAMTVFRFPCLSPLFFSSSFMIIHGNLSAICLLCKGLSSCHEGTYLVKWGSLLMSTTHPWGSVLMCSNYEIKETKSGWKELEATCGEWTHNLHILQCPSSFFRFVSSHLTKMSSSFHFTAFVVCGCKTALLWL